MLAVSQTPLILCLPKSCLLREATGHYALQIMGPDDSYLLHYDPDVKKFWADPGRLALGACFKRAPQSQRVTTVPKQIVTEVRYVA